MSESAAYQCSAAARWLPRVLAGAVLAAALVVAQGLDPQGVVPLSIGLKALVVALGATIALRLLRSGAEVRLEVGLGQEEIEFRRGGRSSSLRYRDIESMDWAAAFGPSPAYRGTARVPGLFGLATHWLPATVLLERHGLVWRIPALIVGGDRLVEELLERCGRSDLDAWAEARLLKRRMGRPSRILALGYVTAGAILGTATAFHLG